MNQSEQIQMPQMSKEAAYGLVEQFRALGRRVALPDKTVRIGADKKTAEFTLRNPWYTGIPVSCVEDVSLRLDGVQIDKERMWFVIREQAIPFASAVEFYELAWSLGEKAVIRAALPEEIRPAAGNICRMELEFEIRTPFEGYHLPNNRIRYLFDEEMKFAGTEGGELS